MLAGFLGCPSSGKSTIATSIFANFKKDLIPTELIIEQARIYISQFRYDNKLRPTDKVVLTDDDQVNIVARQIKHELYFKSSCTEDTIIISDSSMFNSFLYMSPDKREQMETLLHHHVNTYDLLFYCNPVEQDFGLPLDSNRIHSADEIRYVNSEAHNIIKKLEAYGYRNVIHLTGDLDNRIKEAAFFMLQKRSEIILRSA